MPPEPGIAAPSSAHTKPSHSARRAPNTQPITACGPPKATTIAGMVMNGPMPHICDMLMAVAWVTPIRRRR